ncbi:expressed unknown protein [Seminavis robusta]|uniref:Uncharacterized protein n=1 Tax=Seminavis robusta TaxID=568900 RepID=A0A9N8H9S5_9STRA|nr:expressed unknown protein [Seminavis robusta]|eukprot:Sro289_g109190.1 n/a (227) ;mRNA; f:65384-66064
MVIVDSRRALLSVAANSIGGTFLLSNEQLESNPEDLSRMICNYTPKAFRLAVATAGCFLYRGENIPDRVTLLDPEPDLLVPGTYDDPAAPEYFRCLETRLKRSKTRALPSTGHIATSDEAEASQWGEAVSVWPLGDTLSYVWPRQDIVFFPCTTKCPLDEIVIDRELIVALQQGHEVLFASAFDSGRKSSLPTSLAQGQTSAFLAVPRASNDELKEIVKEPQFTLG